jgi:hypothetical protein
MCDLILSQARAKWTYALPSAGYQMVGGCLRTPLSLTHGDQLTMSVADRLAAIQEPL